MTGRWGAAPWAFGLGLLALVDGTTLSQLMLDYNVGVNLVASYEVKRLDSDYFVEE